MNNTNRMYLAALLAATTALGACVARVDNESEASQALRAEMESGDALAAQWRQEIKTDLDLRLPNALSQSLLDAAPPQVLMAADVKASLDESLAYEFSRALDDVNQIPSP